MSLMARGSAYDNVVGPVRMMGCFLCNSTRRVDRAPVWANTMNGIEEMPDKGVMLGNFRSPAALVSRRCAQVVRRLTLRISKVPYCRIHHQIQYTASPQEDSIGSGRHRVHVEGGG